MQTEHKINFGVFADSHYAHRPSDAERFFEMSLEKLRRCIDFFRRCHVDFMVCLGDLVDCNHDDADTAAQLAELLAVLREYPVPLHLSIGNHDVCAMPRQHLLQAFGIGAPLGYESFNAGGLHFVVLDTNYDETDRYYTRDTMQWDRLYIGAKQLNWLEKDLAGISDPTIVFTHGNLDPRQTSGRLDPHVVKDHQAVRRILTASGKVSLVLQGHCHAGYRSLLDGIPYITLNAMVDGRLDNHAIVVSCESSGIIGTLRYEIIKFTGYSEMR